MNASSRVRERCEWWSASEVTVLSY